MPSVVWIAFTGWLAEGSDFDFRQLIPSWWVKQKQERWYCVSHVDFLVASGRKANKMLPKFKKGNF